MAGYVKGSKEYKDHMKRMQLHVGMVKDLSEKGFTIEDIAAKLKLNIETVQNYLNIIAQAEVNKNK